MALVREYIDHYRGDEMEDIFKLLEDRLIQAVGEYVRRKAEKEKDLEWLQPDKWIQKILQDNELGKETKDFWVQALLSHGYHKLVKESLDFERGLNPKKVLSLGIKEQILKYAQLKCQLGDWSWSSPSGWLWEIQEDKDIPLKTKEAWFDYLQSNPDYLKIAMDEHGVILSEAMNFERGLAPNQSMGIGIEGQIREFLDERTSSSPSLWISYLLMEGTFEELPKETRKTWIEFLIKKPEYNSGLGEEDYYLLKEWDIEWIPYVPFSSSDFKYKVIGNQYYIYFNQWEDFSSYFDTNSRDISEKFIEAVLSGDSYEYFDYSLE